MSLVASPASDTSDSNDISTSFSDDSFFLSPRRRLSNENLLILTGFLVCMVDTEHGWPKSNNANIRLSVAAVLIPTRESVIDTD